MYVTGFDIYLCIFFFKKSIERSSDKCVDLSANKFRYIYINARAFRVETLSDRATRKNLRA